MINGDVWRSVSFTYFFILESILILYTINKELISVELLDNNLDVSNPCMFLWNEFNLKFLSLCL